MEKKGRIELGEQEGAFDASTNREPFCENSDVIPEATNS